MSQIKDPYGPIRIQWNVCQGFWTLLTDPKLADLQKIFITTRIN